MIVDLIGFRLVADDLQYIMPSETLSMAPAVVLLVGLIDNAHRLFPEVTHSAMTFLSLCVVRSPSSLLARLDPIPLISSTRFYLLGVAGLLRSRCKVERMFSISHTLNTIPMLYFLGEWTMSKNLLAEQDIPMILSVFFLDIMHIACSGVGDDVQFDVKSYPELSDAMIHTAHLYKANVAAMTRRPLTFTACAILEILARWESHCGVPVSKLRLPSPISDRDESIMQVFQRSLSEFENLVTRSSAFTTNFSFALPIYQAFASGTKVQQPEVGLLRGPLLHSSMKCALHGCSVYEKLKQCSGRCKDLARYCCSEHQRSDWKDHKLFCKEN